MSIHETILSRVREKLGSGLKRGPHEFIYLDRAALYEHFKSITGVSRVPVGFSESKDASAGAGIFGIEIGGGVGTSTSFELSEPHLFESLEPQLREQHPAVGSEEDVAVHLREFVWLTGDLHVVTTRTTSSSPEWDEESRKHVPKKRVEVTRYHGLDVGSHLLTILCDERWFSPFYPFLWRDPGIHVNRLRVEVLAYSTGIASSVRFKTGRSLIFVPTIMLFDDDRTAEDLEEWIREVNNGELSRSVTWKSTRKKSEEQQRG